MRLSIISFLLLVGMCLAHAQNLNEQVLKVANAYSGGGYKWAGTGTPKDLFFKGTRILGKSAEGTYCSGYTFMVAFEVLHESGLLDGLDVATVRRLQQNWYGTNDQSAETQCQMALEKLNLGKRVTFEEAAPGDFVQFWRNNKSGHSAIWLGWEKDNNGTITGIRYRSTQKATNGIGDRVEPIGSGEKDINMARLYVVRAGAGSQASTSSQ